MREMPWKFESDRPIYAQILEQIKERIIVGEYPPGSRLPSVRELATEAAVNPNTMHTGFGLKQTNLLFG